MKILVFSDSHGNTEYMEQAMLWEKPDAALHLGDHASDFDHLMRHASTVRSLRVLGNCDPFESGMTEILTLFDHVPVYMTHGHLQGVKSGLLRLSMTAREKQAKIALFGHTHVPYCEEVDGIWFLNPGSCRSRQTYGRILIENHEIKSVEILDGRSAEQ